MPDKTFPMGPRPTDADSWQLDPDRLDETRAALRTIVDPTNPGVRPLISLDCVTPKRRTLYPVLRTVDDLPYTAWGNLRQIRLGTHPSTISVLLELGRPGLIRAALDSDADGVVVFANDAPVVAVAGRHARRLPTGLLHVEASRVPLGRLAPLLATAADTLAGLDLGASKPLAKTPDLSFVAAAPRLQWLDLRDNKKLCDLAPLAACPSLDTLLLFGCTSVVDLSPLAGLRRLEALFLTRCAVVDLSPLVGLPALRELGLRGCSGVDTASEVYEELVTRPGLVVQT